MQEEPYYRAGKNVRPNHDTDANDGESFTGNNRFPPRLASRRWAIIRTNLRPLVRGRRALALRLPSRRL